MIENYEKLKSNELKHLCHVTFRSNMNDECELYLEEIIKKDKRLERNMQILFAGNFKKIYLKLKNKIIVLENEYKKLQNFSKKESNKIYDLNKNKKIINLNNKYGLDSNKHHQLIKSFLDEELNNLIKKTKNDLLDKISTFIALVNFLLQNSNNILDKALYDKMKGDFNRYAINLTDDEDDKNRFRKESEDSYVKGIDKIKDYPFSEPILLSLYLNYAVFLFEENNKEEDAFDYLNLCIKSCIDLELNDEARGIYNLIKENYEIWKLDNPKKQENDNDEFEDDENEDDNEDEIEPETFIIQKTDTISSFYEPNNINNSKTFSNIGDVIYRDDTKNKQNSKIYEENIKESRLQDGNNEESNHEEPIKEEINNEEPITESRIVDENKDKESIKESKFEKEESNHEEPIKEEIINEEPITESRIVDENKDKESIKESKVEKEESIHEEPIKEEIINEEPIEEEIIRENTNKKTESDEILNEYNDFE